MSYEYQSGDLFERCWYTLAGRPRWGQEFAHDDPTELTAETLDQCVELVKAFPYTYRIRRAGKTVFGGNWCAGLVETN